MQTEDAGVKSSHPHFKFKKGNDMNDTVTKGNAAALLPIGVFLLIFVVVRVNRIVLIVVRVNRIVFLYLYYNIIND